MLQLLVILMQHALLRQNLFRLSGFAVIVTTFRVALTSQRNNFVVAIADHFLWLNFRNDRTMFLRVILVNVRIPSKLYWIIRWVFLIRIFNLPINNSVFQFFFVDFFVRLLESVPCCVAEALTAFLSMDNNLPSTLDIAVRNRETVLDFDWSTFGEHFLQSVVFFQEQVAVGICRTTAVACLRQKLGSLLLSINFTVLARRNRVICLASTQLLFGNQVSQTEWSKKKKRSINFYSKLRKRQNYSKLMMDLLPPLGAFCFESWDSNSKIQVQITAGSILAKSEKYADIISWKAEQWKDVRNEIFLLPSWTHPRRRSFRLEMLPRGWRSRTPILFHRHASSWLLGCSFWWTETSFSSPCHGAVQCLSSSGKPTSILWKDCLVILSRLTTGRNKVKFSRTTDFRRKIHEYHYNNSFRFIDFLNEK